AETDTYTAHKHHQVIVGEHQDQHRKHEQIHAAEEAVVSAFVRHVAGGINMNQEPYARHYQQHDGGELVKLETDVHVQAGRDATREMKGAQRKPGVNGLQEDVARNRQKFAETSECPKESDPRQADRND